MKKSILLFAAALGLLTACDPVKDDKDFDLHNVSTQELSSCISFTQTDADGNPAADGNYFTFTTNPATVVTIFSRRADGSENILAYGNTSGSFSLFPARGSDPNQTIYTRVVNSDGSETVVENAFNVYIQSELSIEVKLLASNDGSKTWKWNTAAPDGQVWGNMGGAGDDFSGLDFALNGSGKWWGVISEEEFMGQLNHTNDGQAHGDESMDATMVFTEDGMIYCYDADGNQIRSGKYEIRDYDPTYSKSKKYCGILHTDAGSILFPYEINSNGNMPTDFQIAYLSPGRLVLLYPDTGTWDNDNWGEGTFWQFCSTTDVLGCLTDNDEATWEWDDDNGQCWGNAGYGSLVYAGAGAVTDGAWWAITSDGIAEQVESYGYGFADGAGATMTFSNDGLVKKSSGGSGAFSYDITNTTDLGGYNEGKTCGRFMTTGDGILFAQRINAGDHTDLPATISEFDIAFINDDHFVLASPSFYLSSGGASWQECTFWRFKKVK